MRGTEDGRTIFVSSSFFVPAEGADELEFLWVSFAEASVEIDDRAKDRHRHSCDNDCAYICTQPYDQEWGKGGFWQTV